MSSSSKRNSPANISRKREVPQPVMKTSSVSAERACTYPLSSLCRNPPLKWSEAFSEDGSLRISLKREISRCQKCKFDEKKRAFQYLEKVFSVWFSFKRLQRVPPSPTSLKGSHRSFPAGWDAQRASPFPQHSPYTKKKMCKKNVKTQNLDEFWPEGIICLQTVG